MTFDVKIKTAFWKTPEDLSLGDANVNSNTRLAGKKHILCKNVTF